MILENSNLIEKDFDKIAIHSENRWDHNGFYHKKLLSLLPNRVDSSLEIGCGKGDFTRLLAERSNKVHALDLSQEMIRIAKINSADYLNIIYQTRDVNIWEYPKNEYDVIVSIATIHHLPFKETLVNMRQALKPGGILVILDLFQIDSLIDRAVELVAIPTNFALSLIKNGFSREPKDLKEAWSLHLERDEYLTLSKIRNICEDLLPNALISRILFWRYLLWWKKTTQHMYTPDSVRPR